MHYSNNVSYKYKDKLVEKPEIKVYGRIAHQHRNIGFFPIHPKVIGILVN
jgi:hypothetical protein